MSSLFYGINIARNALLAQNAVLNVTGHNIANASTPGYSRQQVVLNALSDKAGGGLRSSKSMALGNGVEAAEVTRSRFALYDLIYRNEYQDLTNYQKTEELMNHVELLFDEPSDRGLSSALNEFFSGWQEVANDPTSMAARESLKSLGTELADRIQRVYRQIETISSDIDNEVKDIPAQLNEMTAEIADLNVSIRIAQTESAAANDLLDKRDTLLDKLAEFVDVRAVEQQDGTVTVLIGNLVVVERDTQTDLVTRTLVAEGEDRKKTIIYSEEGKEYVPTTGKLGALTTFRDERLDTIKDQLNLLASSLVQAVNYEHRYGYGLDGETGRNFFNPNNTMAFNISVSSDIADVNHIAASGDGSVGDNANALRIDAVKDSSVVNQQFTLAEHYNAMVVSIGIQAREAKSGRTNEELLVNQINNAREGIKGVSIDEEMIKLLEAQRLYQSAARVITTIDELLATVLQMV